ncbi:hypothetical protein DPMN_064306 [Dreissena polymorpha]|uniref:Uncharacterized protein n=1 Tax=Dreissena polymorpha TaxID=45954 RepID=A0A9D4HL15_DREPO|nr:hypothetical protein DPMN_064306 [Dreissena polymorpha]
MNAWLQRNFNILTADVNDQNFIRLNKDSNSEVTSTTPIKERPNEGVIKKRDKLTDGTLTPVNNGSRRVVHKKLTGGESTAPIDIGSKEGDEKVVGKKDKHKQATGVSITIPANNEPNENRKLAGGDSTTPLPFNSGSNVGVDKSNGNMGNHKQLTDAVLQQTAQKTCRIPAAEKNNKCAK